MDNESEKFKAWVADHSEGYLVEIDDWSAHEGWQAGRADLASGLIAKMQLCKWTLPQAEGDKRDNALISQMIYIVRQHLGEGVR